ncbi:radical SAM/SPASM domain-containing protein [Candidatus Altiarchaeota archaeon]
MMDVDGFVKARRRMMRFYRAWDMVNIVVRYSTVKKILNLIRCLTEYVQGREVLRSYPFEANIESTNDCNLHCRYCRTGQGIPGRDRGAIKIAQFKAIIDDLGEYFYHVSLFGHGEPLLNRDLTSMIRYARQKGIATLIHSNLNIPLRQEMAEDIVDSGLNYLSASIDGTSQETYEKYRIGGDLETVLKNIEKINKAKEKHGGKGPVLTWQFIVFAHNEHELMKAADMAKERGMRFNVKYPSAPEKFKLKEYADREVFSGGDKCRFPWTQLNVAWDGSVTPCCFAFRKEEDFGRIGEKDFRKLWNNERFLDARRYCQDNKNMGEEWILCHDCSIERVINEIEHHNESGPGETKQLKQTTIQARPP